MTVRLPLSREIGAFFNSVSDVSGLGMVCLVLLRGCLFDVGTFA